MKLYIITFCVISACLVDCYSPFLANKQKFGQFRSRSSVQWAQPSVLQQIDTNATLQGGIGTNAFETMSVEM